MIEALLYELTDQTAQGTRLDLLLQDKLVLSGVGTTFQTDLTIPADRMALLDLLSGNVSPGGGAVLQSVVIQAIVGGITTELRRFAPGAAGTFPFSILNGRITVPPGTILRLSGTCSLASIHGATLAVCGILVPRGNITLGGVA